MRRRSSWTRPQQFAYWVNLYNAATVDLVLDNPGVTDIRTIDGGLLRNLYRGQSVPTRTKQTFPQCIWSP